MPSPHRCDILKKIVKKRRDFFYFFCLVWSPFSFAKAFLIFHERYGKDVSEFLDSLEMAHLISERDQEDIKLWDLSLVLKKEAKS